MILKARFMLQYLEIHFKPPPHRREGGKEDKTEGKPDRRKSLKCFTKISK